MAGKRLSPARALALVGISAATVECAKLVLASLPNVEVVTLLLALYGYCFGALGVMAAVVFVCIEPIVWGVGPWFVTYLIYWPLVALVFWLLRAVRVKNRWIITGVAVILTVFFGVFSSLVDVGLFTGFFDKFFERFAVYYARGAVFYAIEIGCNAVLFPVLFPFLSAKLEKIRARLYQ